MILLQATLLQSRSVGSADTAAVLDELGPVILAWGWLFVVFLVLWLAWEAYKLIKAIDYVSAIQWTYLHITIPPEAEQTPKAMENAIRVLAGVHKGPDLIEKYFEGYKEAWYSLEMHCEMGRARYIMVIPTVHRRFFEGVIYGQYPSAEINEVEDYSQQFHWRDLREKFDMWGSEVVLTEDDIYPIRTYHEYEDSFAPEDKFVDPHQAIVEAYTNVGPGEQYWFQILVRPIDAKDMNKWSEKGQEEVAKISGQADPEPEGIGAQLKSFLTGLPGELMQVLTAGPVEVSSKDDDQSFRFFNPVDDAKMKAILQKIGQEAYKTKIRIIYIAPLGQLHKPNVGRAFGVFKQFNTLHLNSLKPDGDTKTNGPNYVLKQTRRKYRERVILLLYQWRDFWEVTDGDMLTAEEIATLYHFPALWVRAPVVQRAKSGLQSAPDNLPYV